eukprot:364476-Chlamydomonas_euryale.AAC.2
MNADCGGGGACVETRVALNNRPSLSSELTETAARPSRRMAFATQASSASETMEERDAEGERQREVVKHGGHATTSWSHRRTSTPPLAAFCSPSSEVPRFVEYVQGALVDAASARSTGNRCGGRMRLGVCRR